MVRAHLFPMRSLEKPMINRPTMLSPPMVASTRVAQPGGDAQVDGMGHNVQQHREHADQQEKVRRTDQPQLQILQRLPQGKSCFAGLGDIGSHPAVTVGAQAASGRIAHQQLGQPDERDQHHDTHDKKRRPPAKGRDKPVGKQWYDQHAHAGSHLLLR